MKTKHISIKWKVFTIFLIFAIVLIGVLWFFQIVYLNDFYKMIKREETEAVLDEVEYLLQTSDNVADDIEETAACNNLAIYITDSEGQALYNAEYISNSQMSSLPQFMFELFYNEAVANGGEAVIEYKGSEMLYDIGGQDDWLREDMPPEQSQELQSNEETSDSSTDAEAESVDNFESDNENASDAASNTQQNNPGVPDLNVEDDSHVRIEYTIPKESIEEFRQNIGNDMAESVIYVRIVEVDGAEEVVMINSVLTPVDATVSTLKAQLKLISVIMIVVAFLIAVGISKSISKSIIKLNAGARLLAEGNYDVVFDSRDYKEIAQLSDSLNHAATELGKTDSLQKELIANVSHDLRTPLTMIKGYAEVMRDIPGENTPENVQVIIEETERLSGLVNDMLDISKLKAGTIQIKPEEYNITESIKHVLSRYNKLREVEGYTIDFLYDEEVNVYADEQKMYQVLYNLVNNAINYTGEDKKVTVIQKVMDNTLRIEVKDTGEGVSQEDIPYVWDRYYKDKSTHKRAIQGTGLGLSIVKSVLELHGAKYGVSSQKGHGATFWFEIEINPFEDDE